MVHDAHHVQVALSNQTEGNHGKWGALMYETRSTNKKTRTKAIAPVLVFLYLKG